MRLKRKRSDPCRKSHGDPSAFATNLLSSMRHLARRAPVEVISEIVCDCCYVYVHEPAFQRPPG